MDRTREQIAEELTRFARDNKLKIHPGQEPLKWGDLLIRKGGRCPCVPGRDRCPCDLAILDIKELGRCRCGLFCNDAYIREYSRLTGDRKASKRWKKKQGKSSY